MNIADALNILKQACAQFRGTLADHEQIQAALKIVEMKANPPPLTPEVAAPASAPEVIAPAP